MPDNGMPRLGVLDQVTAFSGRLGVSAVRECLELASAVEAMGYERFWIAEHHGGSGNGCASPEVLIAAVGGRTSRIRIGSGGVLLPYQRPLKIAENFRMLEALYPGRVDLGIGRGPGAPPSVQKLLALDANDDDQELSSRLREVVNFLYDRWPRSGEQAGAVVIPTGGGQPQLWSLGASANSARIAGTLGLPFCFAQFIFANSYPEVMETYRNSFVPSPTLSAPWGSLAVRIACSDDPRTLSTLRITVPAVDALPTADPSSATPALNLICGSPDEVADSVGQLAAKYQADELILTTHCPDLEVRIRIYELFREAFLRREPAGI